MSGDIDVANDRTVTTDENSSRSSLMEGSILFAVTNLTHLNGYILNIQY